MIDIITHKLNIISVDFLLTMTVIIFVKTVKDIYNANANIIVFIMLIVVVHLLHCEYSLTPKN